MYIHYFSTEILDTVQNWICYLLWTLYYNAITNLTHYSSPALNTAFFKLILHYIF